MELKRLIDTMRRVPLKKKAKVGRPRKPLDEKKGAGLRVRLTPEERAKVDRAVAAAGGDLSTWVRNRLLDGL